MAIGFYSRACHVAQFYNFGSTLFKLMGIPYRCSVKEPFLFQGSLVLTTLNVFLKTQPSSGQENSSELELLSSFALP